MHLTAVARLQDDRAVEAAPDLTAIQLGYEEAKAFIVDPARAPWSAAEGADELPGTERIDLRAVRPPPPVARRPRAEAAAAGPARSGWWQRLRTALGAAVPAGQTAT